MIKVENLVYDYGNFRALKGVSFELPNNSIVALVGHNGAGKTTLFKCLSGLQTPSEGWVEIDGIREPHLFKQHIGFLQDFIGVYEDLTVKQCLEYFGEAYGLSPQKISARINDLADSLKLREFIHKKAGSLSRGMKQRLAIAQSIIHEPKLLLLDEPASGLDPQSRLQLAELFKSLKQQGITLLVSSHILSELDQYADELMILDHGLIIKNNSEEDLNRLYEIRCLEDPQVVLDKFSAQFEIPFTLELLGNKSWALKIEMNEEQQLKLIKDLTLVGLLEFVEVKNSIQEDYLKLVDAQGGSHVE